MPGTQLNDLASDNLRELIERKGLTADVKYGAEPSATFPNANGYTVTLHYQGRTMVVPFYMGEALTDEPTAADVLDCLCSDASAVDYCRDEYDFATEYGYTPSRETAETFRTILRQTSELRDLLGDDFDTFYGAERL